MTDSVADDILRNGFDRWKRLEEEKQAISDDLKELFAELKGQGFDGKALRAAFRHVVKIDDLANQEHEAVVDLYVESLTRDTRVRAREIIEEFPAETVNPETGEITERILSNSGHDDPKTADLVTTPDPAQEPQSVPSAAQGSDEAPFVASQPIQPETANTNEPAAAVETAGDYLREPVATEQGQIAQGGDAPREAVANATGEVLPGQNAHLSTDAGSSSGRTAEFDSANDGSNPSPVAIELPEVPADFKTDQTPDQLAARMRRTLRVRPLCQRSYSCGRMADQSECGQCLKAAQERAA